MDESLSAPNSEEAPLGAVGETSRAGPADPSEELSPADPSKAKEPCLVVGIGASAGGLGSFQQVLGAMPVDTGMAFVLIQHLDPNHESLMAELLGKYTSMPVVQVEKTTELQAAHVYVIPPNKFIKLEAGRLLLDAPVKERGMRMPIDYFFRSLADVWSVRSVAVVLSGTGSDGSQGVRAVKAAGGMTIAQNPATAEYDGMPRSAIETGMVDQVLDLEKIPKALAQYARHPYASATAESSLLADKWPDEFQSILSLLRNETPHDFRSYKKGTLSRRIQSRMALRHVDNPQDYLGLLRQKPKEVEQLAQDLLIGVTRFFRDQEAWEALRKSVVIPVIEKKQTDEPVRIWVPGCASGEEAYSLLMIFSEECERLNKPLKLQLFGTDVDARAIALARSGEYPDNITEDLSQERMEKFVVLENNRCKMIKPLRESAVFAVQNIIGDPPFSHLDLVSCRNLFIYLETEVQGKLMQLLHFGLVEGGYLFLGSAEAINQGGQYFEPVCEKWRIYQNKKFSVVPDGYSIAPASSTLPLTDKAKRAPRAASAGPAEAAKRFLLNTYAPPSVLIDAQQQVKYFHGALEPFLAIPTGEPTSKLLDLAIDPIRYKIRSALAQAMEGNEEVVARIPRMPAGGRDLAARIHVRPLIRQGEPPRYLISFIEEETLENSISPADYPAEDEDREALLRLEDELRSTREDLHGHIEEMETANEELKASNEEMMSMNEELQSTNEELETSREELQSLNEELTTVNAQLEEKVGEVESVNNDLTNLLFSTEIATLFLDTDFRIRRFTPACEKFLSIIASDVGRPITDLALRLNDAALLMEAEQVLEKLTPVSRQLETNEGRSFMRRILPYRTSDRRIDGVVVTITEITSIIQARKELEIREAQHAALAKLGQSALASKELDDLFDIATQILADALRTELVKILRLRQDERGFDLVAGHGWEEGAVGNTPVPGGLDSQAGFTMYTASPVVVEDLAKEKRFRGPQLLHDHGVVSGMSVIVGTSNVPWGVVGVHTQQHRSFTGDDINFLQAVANILTEAIARRQAEQRIADREKRLRLVADAMPMLIAYCDKQEVYRYCNAAYREWFGLSPDDVLGRRVREVVGEPAYSKIQPYIKQTLEGEHLAIDTQLPYRHGPVRNVHIAYVPHVDGNDKVIGYYAMIEDTSKRLEAQRTGERLAAIVNHSNDAIVGLNVEGQVTDWNSAAHKIFGRASEDMVGQPIWIIADSASLPIIKRILQGVKNGTAVRQEEVKCLRADNTPLYISMSASPIRASDGAVSGVSVILRDATERIKAQQHLHELAEKLEERVAERTAVAEKRAGDLRALTNQITLTEQRVRKRLATTIHDDLQQILVAAIMRLPPSGPTAQEEGIDRVRQLLESAVDKTRMVVRELNPPILHEGSIADIFKWLVRQMQEQYHLSVTLRLESVPEQAEDPLKNLLFESVRELLFNVVKHAGVEKAVLSIRSNQNALTVVVEDEGRGFDFSSIDPSTSGFGLLNVRERIEAFDGSMQVTSEHEQGTRISICVPTTDSVRYQDASTPEAIDQASSSGEGSSLSRSEETDISILIVDDHRIVRDGLSRILSSEPGMKVIGEAANGEEGIEQAMALKPDVVVMDISMPKMNGIEATRQLSSRMPEVVIVGLSLYEAEDLGAAMRQAGAAAFVQKSEVSANLLQTIYREVKDRADSAES